MTKPFLEVIFCQENLNLFWLAKLMLFAGLMFTLLTFKSLNNKAFNSASNFLSILLIEGKLDFIIFWLLFGFINVVFFC